VQMAPADGKALISLSIGEGSSLQEAANTTATNYKLNVINSKNVTVNGLQALEVISSLSEEDPSTGTTSTLSIKSMYIRYKELIYVIHGFALAQDFNAYVGSFDKVMYGFKELKDVAKINVQPERIDIVPASKSGTLGQVLNAHGVPTSRHRELSILNGMEVTEQVQQGTLIKLIIKSTGTQP